MVEGAAHLVVFDQAEIVVTTHGDFFIAADADGKGGPGRADGEVSPMGTVETEQPAAVGQKEQAARSHAEVEILRLGLRQRRLVGAQQRETQLLLLGTCGQGRGHTEAEEH